MIQPSSANIPNPEDPFGVFEPFVEPLNASLSVDVDIQAQSVAVRLEARIPGELVGGDTPWIYQLEVRCCRMTGLCELSSSDVPEEWETRAMLALMHAVTTKLAEATAIETQGLRSAFAALCFTDLFGAQANKPSAVHLDESGRAECECDCTHAVAVASNFSPWQKAFRPADREHGPLLNTLGLDVNGRGVRVQLQMFVGDVDAPESVEPIYGRVLAHVVALMAREADRRTFENNDRESVERLRLTAHAVNLTTLYFTSALAGDCGE